MSKPIIQIIAPTSTVRTGDHFLIAIKEVACTNCQWEVKIPYEITTISTVPSTLNPQHLHQWVFTTTTRGTYTLIFSYVKRCCGKPVLQKEQFTVIVR